MHGQGYSYLAGNGKTGRDAERLKMWLLIEKYGVVNTDTLSNIRVEEMQTTKYEGTEYTYGVLGYYNGPEESTVCICEKDSKKEALKYLDNLIADLNKDPLVEKLNELVHIVAHVNGVKEW